MEIPVAHEAKSKQTQGIPLRHRTALTLSCSSSSSPPSNSTSRPSSSLTTSSLASSTSSTSRILPISRDISRCVKTVPMYDSGHGEMHTEKIVVRPNCSSTPVTTTENSVGDVTIDNIGQNEDCTIGKSGQPILHTRLPSTDSGIQADGGFDSLSRYRGKTFLSASSTNDSINSGTDVSNSSNSGESSSGYSSEYPQNPHPNSSLLSRVISIPAQSFVANSKPLTPPVATSSVSTSKAPACRSVTNSNPSTSSSIQKSFPSLLIYNSKFQTEAQDRPLSSQSSQPPLASSSTSSSSSPATAAAPTSLRCGAALGNMTTSTHATLSGKPVANRRTVFNPPSLANQSGIPNSSDVHSTTNSASKSVLATPGSAVKVRIINMPSQPQGQSDKVKANQGQGCIALTRPLRVGPPPKLSVRAIQPTSLSLHTTQNSGPTVRVQLSQQQPHQQQQQQQQQQQSFPAEGKLKPTIAPRTSLATKMSSLPSNMISGSNKIDTVSASTHLRSSSDKDASDSNSSKVSSSTKPKSEYSHKTEIPVFHSEKMGRTEIPVKHVASSAASAPQSHSISKPTSSYRTRSHPHYTSEKDTDRGKGQSPIETIYERTKITTSDDDDCGFNLKDYDARMKHAELILKQSDELLNDAMKMLRTSSISPSTSPLSSKFNGFSSADLGVFPEGERIVEGCDTTVTSEREHTIPIYDVRTGKYHGKGKTTDGTDVNSSSSNKEGTKGDVSWKERKERIDSALSWLKHELAGLRDMDNSIISQFKRCQDTIEALKSQRDVWEGLSEEGEESEYWDDYEINEFNKKFLDSPGGSSCSQFSLSSRDTSLNDVTSVSLPVPKLTLPHDSRTVSSSSCDSGKSATCSNGSGSGLTQDVEATL